MPRLHANPVRRRDGFVLIAVLVVVVLLSLAAYQFSELMLAEYRAADSHARQVQAKALAESGVQYAAVMLSNSTAFANNLNSNPWDNPSVFQNVPVNPQDAARLQGAFTLVAPIFPDDPSYGTEPFRYGVTDESAKINLNTIMQLDSSGSMLYNMLMALPNMTDTAANSIIDWIDTDETPRSDGAESDYYSSLTPAYSSKDGPLDTVEELLLVNGVTPQLLLGNDLNRNGVLEPNEDDGSGVTNPGMAEYLTVYSRELNVDSQGNPRIYINGSDLNGLYTQLSTVLNQDIANFIVAYRIYGSSSGTSGGGGGGGAGGGGGGGGGGGAGGMAGASGGGAAGGGAAMGGAAGGGGGAGGRGGGGGGAGGMASAGGGGAGSGGAAGGRLNRNQLDLTRRSQQSISSLYALLNASVSIPGNTPNAPATTYQSPLRDPGTQQQYLPILLDECTTVQGNEVPPRINVNTASPTVLAALPGLTTADVQNIVSNRPNPSSGDAPDPSFQTPAWLVTQANISISKMQTLERYITARTQVYRVQAVGRLNSGGPAARVEAVIDTNLGYPRILYHRDLSELGSGFNLGPPLGTGGNGP
jgi:type II secretory pathway component PulK